MSLEAFGVKNLRCLTDTGLVPIRPITVLVGRNSSGKSTFLRAFPLLRQSVETARNSPILWYHERYVDFGSLKDAANNRLSEPSVTLHFQLRPPRQPLLHQLDGSTTIVISATLVDGDPPFVAGYDTWINGCAVEWIFDQSGTVQRLNVDSRSVELPGPYSLRGTAYLLPSPHPGEVSDVRYMAAPDLLKAPRPVPNFKPSPPKRRTTLPVEAAQSLQAIRAADINLRLIMSRVAYLAPLRVSAKRDYRIQNLATDEIDPDGNNLAMFLRSLSPEEEQDFASFTQDALNFETAVKSTGLHAEILIREGTATKFVNLVDVGFGYSEVLPLAAILWASCTQHSHRPVPIIAIEQPELHLHPAHQAKLARMFVEAVRRSGGKSTVLVETHSESLINGLGKQIYDGAIKAEDVQIVLFDQDEETRDTTVSLAGYRDNGALHDWPYGFLSPVAERRAPRTAAE